MNNGRAAEPFRDTVVATHDGAGCFPQIRRLLLAGGAESTGAVADELVAVDAAVSRVRSGSSMMSGETCAEERDTIHIVAFAFRLCRRR